MDADNRQEGGGSGRVGHGPTQGLPSEHVVDPVDYDAELQRHNEVLLRAYNIQTRDQILDIGCGTGQTSRDAARLAAEGNALGVDLSAEMIARARGLARAEGLGNVAFEHADAQVHSFPQERFDLAISRFGTMFFRDAVAAFANIRRALQPGGRLVVMVWQEHEQNEWSVAIERSLGPRKVAPPTSETWDPFSLADPPTVQTILGAAGFGELAFTDVHEPVYYGPDVAAALEWVRGFTSTRQALEPMDRTDSERALQRLRETLARHTGEDGVWFDARAWIVEARRR